MSDLIDKLNRYESGEMDEREAVDFIATLVATGTVWVLQGSYQRAAAALIRDGFITVEGEVLVDVQ